MKIFWSLMLSPLILVVCAGCDGPQAKSSSDTSSVLPSTENASAAANTTTTKSPWNLTKDVNELDNKTNITLSSYDVYLRCSPKLEGYIKPSLTNLGHSLESENGGGQTVRFRIDNSPIRKQHWSMSTDYEALFLPTPILLAAMKGKKLVVEYKPSYVVAKSETFDFDGLQEAAHAAGCKF